MSQPTLRTVRQNRPFKGPLDLMLPNGGGAYALPSAFATYELRLYRHNNVTPFATGTVANGKIGIAVTAAATTITLNFPATDMGGLLGYGSMELISTDAGSEPVVVVPLQFVKEDTPYTVDAGQRLAIFAEHVVCVVRATTVAFALADSTFTLAQLNDAVSDGNVASEGDLAGLQAALDGKASLASPAFAGTPTAPTAAPGTNTTQIASTAFVAAAVASGGGGTGGDVSAALAGASALDVLPQALRGRKALALDLAGQAYAAFNDGSAAAMGDLAAYISITITNSTGGTRLTRKRLLESVAANALRLTHDGLGRPMGALLEDVDTNLLVWSEQMDNAAWAKVSALVSANASAAPDGTITADKLVGAAGVALSAQYVSQNVSKAAAALPFTLSIFAKKAELDRVRVLFNDNANAANSVAVIVDLNAGAIVSTATATGTFSNPAAVVSDAGNGWWRVAVSALTATETVIRDRIYAYDSVATTGDGASGILIWGAQFEQAGAPGSYIATTTAQASRAADVLFLPVSGFTADEITVAGEFTAPWPDALTRTAFCLKNGGDKLEMNFASGSSVPVIKLTVGGTEQFGGSAVALTPGQSYRFYVAASRADKLLRWKFQGAAAGSVGPTSPLSITTAFTPANLDVGNAGGAAQLSSAIRSLAIVDRAWTAGEGEGYTDPGGAAVLSNAEVVLTADVQLLVSNTFYDGPSITLDAGTWLIEGKAQYLKTTTTASQVTARLHDGTDTLDDAQEYHASVANSALSFRLVRIKTFAAPVTVKLQMATTVGVATALMKATAPNNGSANNATRISAVRIG